MSNLWLYGSSADNYNPDATSNQTDSQMKTTLVNILVVQT